MKKIFIFIFVFISLSFTNTIFAQIADPIIDPIPVCIDPQILIDNVCTDPVPPPTPNENFIIRNGDTVLYSGSVLLPPEGTVQINDIAGVSHDIDARSVLAILKSIDEANDAFSISNLQYFDSFGAFYIKCILLNTGEELCDNWQYAVGSLTPFSSIDTTILSGDETIGIYFGTSHQLTLSKNIVIAGESFTASAQKYDYENNTWNPLTGVNIGVTLPNLAEPWNPTVINTYPVDTLGIANISIADANTYTLGIVEDYYFPSYTVTVKVRGGGGGTTTNFDVEKALDYLKGVQETDGSFTDSLLYTDWAAIAFGAMNVDDDTTDKILNYLESNNEVSTILTENERRAMALLSLNQDPYSFNGVDYIGAIIDTFDGTQFGDIDLINDDIFALIPLKNSGYSKNDEIIKKDVAFLISKQKDNGSWEESTDITAAAIQALEPFSAISGVSDALSNATIYLKNEQNDDGGWDSVFSTSWVLQSMNALSDSWIKNGKSGMNYLGTQQETDGAVSSNDETLENRIWATSYAIAAGSGKPWSEIMNTVPKPNSEDNSSGTGDNEISTETTAIEITPVSCPEGDLFNAQTGEACTKFFSTDSVTIPPTPEKITISLSEKSKDTPTNNLEEENTPSVENTEINADTLIASALESSKNNTAPYTFPIILGSISSIVLLYSISKIFAKK